MTSDIPCGGAERPAEWRHGAARAAQPSQPRAAPAAQARLLPPWPPVAPAWAGAPTQAAAGAALLFRVLRDMRAGPMPLRRPRASPAVAPCAGGDLGDGDAGARR